MTQPTVADLERNVTVYRLLELPTRGMFWLPTVFLYLIAEFGLADALRLQAAYYFAVVVFEVPSGWMSDRLGRVPTMKITAISWTAAHTLFLFSDNSQGMALSAQILLALGFASLSGTDVTFHYESLEALGRAHTFEEVEGHARRNGLVAKAVAAVIGGALGLIDLRLPFAASLIAALYQTFLVWGLTEPPRQARAERFDRQLSQTLAYLRNPLLAWLTFYVLAKVVMEHLASEMASPYLVEILGEGVRDLDNAPLVLGLLTASAAIIGASVVRRTAQLRAATGLVGALVLLSVVPTAIVVTMALVTSPWVIPFFALRNLQSSMAPVLIAGAANARVQQQHRATFLSLSSLGGRLTYSGVLLGLSTNDSFDTTIQWSAAIALVGFAAVWLTSLMVSEDDPTRSATD